MMLMNVLSKLKFTSPEKNDIVILYAEDYWLRRLVLKDLPSTTIELYPERIYVTPMLIARTLWRLRLVDWFKSDEKPVLKDLLRRIYAQYVLACIDQTTAKVVLTFIDNSAYFQILSRIDQKRTYFAIQNGTRTLFCVRDSLLSLPKFASTISMTNFFCFGKRDIDLYTRNGHKIDAYIPVGSLVGGYYKSQISVPVTKPLYDLCLISQWNEQFFGNTDRDGFSARWLKKVTGLNAFLVRLLDETGLTLVICPRNDNDAAEWNFFKISFGEKARIEESDRKGFSTYRVVDQSQLTIAVDSTVLLETFSCGQKVLWCNVPDDEFSEMPHAGISYFRGDDYDAFKERVLMLLKMSQEDYELQTRERARYINNFDPACPPHEIIRAAILKAQSKVE